MASTSDVQRTKIWICTSLFHRFLVRWSVKFSCLSISWHRILFLLFYQRTGQDTKATLLGLRNGRKAHEITLCEIPQSERFKLASKFSSKIERLETHTNLSHMQFYGAFCICYRGLRSFDSCESHLKFLTLFTAIIQAQTIPQ